MNALRGRASDTRLSAAGLGMRHHLKKGKGCRSPGWRLRHMPLLEATAGRRGGAGIAAGHAAISQKDGGPPDEVIGVFRGKRGSPAFVGLPFSSKVAGVNGSNPLISFGSASRAVPFA